MLSRFITGGIIILFGVFIFFFAGFIDGPGIDYLGIIFGALICLFGLIIFFNKKEDEIEQVKKVR